MNYLYKRIKDDDGENCNDDTWHVMSDHGEACRILCTSEAYDASSDLTLEQKIVSRGGITCNHCLEIVKVFKAIKL